MGKNVYANGNEIACKSSDCKVIAAFPDVCMSPPPPPAGPIPVPYPNSSASRDMKQGSKSVKIGGGPVMLRDKSFYETSPLGDEAATRNFGAGVINHSLAGKTRFVAWSMDVKFERQNVDRHIDITTSNHGSNTNVPAPAPNTSGKSADKPNPTYGLRRDEAAACHHNGEHTWVCDMDVCDDCWVPPCEPNAKALNQKYAATRQGDEAQRIASAKAAIHQKIASRNGDVGGRMFELKAVDMVKSVGQEILAIGYAVHCTACHLRVDIDIVTPSYVIECKKSYTSFRMSQFTGHLISAAKHCFGEQRVVGLTDPDQMADLGETLKIWKKNHGVDVGLFPL